MTATPDLVLYHAPQSRSVRVRWMLEEMGLPHRLEPVKFDTRPAGDEAYAEINPLRKVPAMTIDGAPMLESTAMLEYLAVKCGPTDLAVSPNEDEYARWLQFIHFAEASMAMPVNLLLGHTALLPEDKRDPKLAAYAQYEVNKLLDYLGNIELKDREYLVADRFTAADIAVVYMLYLLKIIRGMKAAPDNLNAYFKRITEREAWKVASGRS
jgi:glutathione S-transferase